MSPKLALGLFGLGCVAMGLLRSGNLAPAVAGRKHVEISFWNGFTGPDGRTMLGMIREFNRENPDVNVSMQRMDWATYYNKLMVAAVDDRGPELFIVHASTLPRMHNAGFIADLSSLFDGASGIPRTDFEPYVLDQTLFDGKNVGVPLDIHPQGMFCNKKLLREAGISKPPTNKDEFLKAIRATKTSSTWGFALTLWQNNFQALIPQFGGHYLDEKGNADLNNPNNVAALEFLASLVKNKLTPPPENGLGWVGYRQAKVSMVWDGVYMVGDLKRLNDLEYEGVPIPTLGKQPGTMADSHVMCMRSGLSREKQDAVKRFVKYLSAHSLAWADAGQVPARKSVRENPEFKKMQVQYAFSKQIPHMMYPPRTPVLFELSLEIQLAVEKVIRGRESALQALTTANQNAQKAIDRFRRESHS